MGFLSDVLSRGAIAAQGAELARSLARRLPVERVGEEKKVAVEFDILVGTALGYQRKANLGVLGKSHLVNSFQWTLIQDGYPEAFSQDLGSKLAVLLAGQG